MTGSLSAFSQLPDIPADRPVLIAGPTASGKSALALAIAETFGGTIVNADASQVYDCWRVVSARPDAQEESRAPHALYGHLAFDAPYSAGHWMRDVTPLLSASSRPIIVGGTGLYFAALTQGIAAIPPTPAAIRAQGDTLSLEEMRSALDVATAGRIDLANRARVQRAWEVLRATGRGLAQWQDETPPPVLDIRDAVPLVFDVDREWLLQRITRRFDLMVNSGAIEEVAAMADRYDPSLPAFKAIGVPELIGYIRGTATLDQAREQAHIATRQFAKRQRTWFRARMKAWHQLRPL
jgi:tRNA dimethylallyltransferase